eukprot:CAMPEP_0113855066 /NCGR_PEP_ID=MMETSP0372-20130328/7884_1 /TAXON_ID=340204 /ORGANISM="Lankesteria abbotti" /LENGTH=113 /DNA_ID=CAMNT_0000828735 /DNA_START=30 /DNA_END=369 /DNA_ORIENTATION=- /assembly_acc=CAM_ASM_000359
MDSACEMTLDAFVELVGDSTTALDSLSHLAQLRWLVRRSFDGKDVITLGPRTYMELGRQLGDKEDVATCAKNLWSFICGVALLPTVTLPIILIVSKDISNINFKATRSLAENA